jgi:hypothetical protein
MEKVPMAEPRQIDLETFAIDGKLGPFQESIHLNQVPANDAGWSFGQIIESGFGD